MARVANVLRGIQLPLLPGIQPYAIPAEPEPIKTVLGDNVSALQLDPPALKSHPRACGWLEEKTSERKRKNQDPWVCKQWWLHWEEPGGKKRSRYVPSGKLAQVKHSVYGLKHPIDETLKLLEKS